jgi:hypothetical protein
MWSWVAEGAARVEELALEIDGALVGEHVCRARRASPDPVPASGLVPPVVQELDPPLPRVLGDIAGTHKSS